MVRRNTKTTAETTQCPLFQRDHLSIQLSKGRSRATQMVPNYRDFRLGQGDPLAKATMKHDIDMAIRPSLQEEESKEPDYDKEINLIQSYSPLSGIGINDIVHLNKKTILSFPILPRPSDDENDEVDNQLDCHNSPLGGMGFNDIVHLPNGTVVIIPIVPYLNYASYSRDIQGGDIVLNEPILPRSDSDVTLPVENHYPKNYFPDHGSPLSVLGMSDIVHLGKGRVIRIPCVNLAE